MLRIFGDIHGKQDEYLKLLEGVDFSIQLGDMGFNYVSLNQTDPSKHKFFKGNHDNPHAPSSLKLDDFGICQLGPYEFFYVGGADSVDKQYRTEGKDWWPEEEISYDKFDEIIDAYKNWIRNPYSGPKLMLTHTCPTFIARQFDSGLLQKLGHNPNIYSSRTQDLLQQLFLIGRPDAWIFGHMHHFKIMSEGKTTFICLDELQYIDFDGKKFTRPSKPRKDQIRSLESWNKHYEEPSN